MKKYVLYRWYSDDECGVSVCYAKDFMSDLKFYHSNCQEDFLTEFDTTDEAVDFCCSYYKLPVEEKENIREDIKYRLYWFHYDRGEYEEAQKFQC